MLKKYIHEQKQLVDLSTNKLFVIEQIQDDCSLVAASRFGPGAMKANNNGIINFDNYNKESLLKVFKETHSKYLKWLDENKFEYSYEYGMIEY